MTRKPKDDRARDLAAMIINVILSVRDSAPNDDDIDRWLDYLTERIAKIARDMDGAP